MACFVCRDLGAGGLPGSPVNATGATRISVMRWVADAGSR